MSSGGGPESLQFPDRASARAFLRPLLGDPANHILMRRILFDLGDRLNIGSLTDHEVIDFVADGLVSGRIRVSELPRSRAGVGQARPREEEEAAEALEAVEATAAHWIEIEFIDSARNPIPVRYDITVPGSEIEQDLQADNGRIDRRELSRGGNCTVEVYRLVSVDWSPARVAPGEEATVRAMVEGYPEETPATIEIFRLHRETAEDVLETISGAVAGNSITATWTPEASPQGAGEFRYVAKVSIGDAWKKTLRPLQVAEPAMVNARWSAAQAEPGDEVTMSVEAPGIPDGTEVTFTVYRERYTVDDEEVAATTGTVTGEEASASWTVAAPGGTQAPVTEGEYYFTAAAGEYDDDSDPLWVENPAGATRPPPLRREDALGEEEEAADWEKTPYVSPDRDDADGDEGGIETDPEGPTALEDEA